MFCVEEYASKSAALGLALALVVTANLGCSGADDQLPALHAETPDAGHPDTPKLDSGSHYDAATPDVIPDSPTANAGTDQTLDAGVKVTLSGKGLDATGAKLDYRWTQIAGPSVTLDAPGQAQTTFTAPLTSGELEFHLAVHSENGQGSDRVKVTVSAAPALFVANRSDASVSRFAISPALSGNVAPEATLKGMNTPSALIVDKADGLVVVTGESSSILGFSNAFGPGGDATPERYFPRSSFSYGSLDAMAYDRASDLLFLVSNSTPASLFVFGDVATRAFTSGAQPKATLTFAVSTNITKVRDLELSASGELYVVHSALFDHNVVVFSKPSTVNILTAWSRAFTIMDMQDTDAFIDASDRLYVVGSRAPEILVYEKASTLQGVAPVARTITVNATPPASGFNGITLDAAGTAYVTASNADAFYVIENVGAKSGAVTPDRTVTGAATELGGPGKLTAVAR